MAKSKIIARNRPVNPPQILVIRILATAKLNRPFLIKIQLGNVSSGHRGKRFAIVSTAMIDHPENVDRETKNAIVTYHSVSNK